MTVRNPYRFESYPVWTNREEPPARSDLIRLARKRRAVRRRDRERAALIRSIGDRKVQDRLNDALYRVPS